MSASCCHWKSAQADRSLAENIQMPVHQQVTTYIKWQFICSDGVKVRFMCIYLDSLTLIGDVCCNLKTKYKA